MTGLLHQFDDLIGYLYDVKSMSEEWKNIAKISEADETSETLCKQRTKDKQPEQSCLTLKARAHKALSFAPKVASCH